MRRALLALLLVPALALAQSMQLSQITASQTGINGTALSTSPQTSAISMLNTQVPASSFNQLTLAWAATIGSEARFTQKRKVGGDARLAHTKNFLEFAHGEFTAAEQENNTCPSGIGQ